VSQLRCITLVALGLTVLGANPGAAQDSARIPAKAVRFRGQPASSLRNLRDSASTIRPVLRRAAASRANLIKTRPGTFYARVDPRHLLVPGAQAAAMGVWIYPSTDTDGRDYLHVIGRSAQLPAGGQPNLMLTINAQPGAFYLVICEVEGPNAQYPVLIRNGLISENLPVATAIPDQHHEISFVVEDAVGGPNVFTLQSELAMVWFGCQVRLLT
jgi:hypothetical protein